MLTSARVTHIAKYLASMSFDADSREVSVDNVRKIIDYISECPERYRAKLLRRYGYFLEEAIRRRSLNIEYAQGCNIEYVKQLMAPNMQQVSKVNIKENPGLICGVRLEFGDFIWERSVRSDLELIAR